jgi:hypothetical protein
MPSGRRLVFQKYDDYFYVRLLTDIYKRYMVTRVQYKKINIETIKDSMSGTKKEKVITDR